MKRISILLIATMLLCSCARNDIKKTYGAPVNEEIEESLKVHFLDVGQADSIFLELPNKETMLIDAGEKKSSAKITDYIKNIGYENITYILATHPHADHIGGLSDILNNFTVTSIYMPKVSTTSKTFEQLLETIKSKNLKIKTGKSGVTIIDEKDLKLELVAPNSDKYSSLNDYSLVLKLTYKDASFLFMGDAEAISESEITSNIDIDILKVGHHGSDTSSSASFLKKVTPKYAIISVGSDNKYNHPSSKTIANLKKYTNNIYETSKCGTIVISSDGINYNIKLEKSDNNESNN